jgi:hypothetical protein
MAFRRKTRPGRLAALDALLLRLEADLLAAPGQAPVVDLGIGAQPWTTLELAAALPGVEVVGVELAADLVAKAQVYARPGLRFVQGSFDLPVGPARVIRVMNVLRDLGPADVPDAHRRMGQGLLDGGVIVEGSCGPQGEVGAAHWLRREGEVLRREALVFWLDGSRGDAPLLFRDRLPRDLRGAAGHAVMGLFTRWMDAYGDVAAGPSRLARAAAACGEPGLVMLGERAARWAPEGGVPPR